MRPGSVLEARKEGEAARRLVSRAAEVLMPAPHATAAGPFDNLVPGRGRTGRAEEESLTNHVRAPKRP
jgi:hypothetical protein